MFGDLVSSTPIFDQLQAEFIEQSKFCRLLIGPPMAYPIVVQGAPDLIKIEPQMDDTVVIEPAQVLSLIDRIRNDETQLIPKIKATPPVVEEEAHVFPLKRNATHKKNSTTRSFGFFNRAA